MSNSLVERIAEKLGSRKSALSRVTLNQNNTYIFPTFYGFGFLVLLLLMLVAAINYQNSLIYLCIFFLGSIFFISIWMCFLNVSSLEVFTSNAEGVFEGQGAIYKIGLHKNASPVFGMQIGFNRDEMEYVSVAEGEVMFHELIFYGLRRGRHGCPKIRIESTYPFGFIRAWTWVRLDCSALVYPYPEYSNITSNKDNFESGESSQTIESSEKDQLREYSEGEPLNRVSWKKFAATDQLFVVNNEKLSSNPSVVSWNDYDGVGKEERLRYMCFRVCELYNNGVVFGIVLPSNSISPCYSKKHFEQCLTALAEF